MNLPGECGSLMGLSYSITVKRCQIIFLDVKNAYLSFFLIKSYKDLYIFLTVVLCLVCVWVGSCFQEHERL